MKSTKAHFELFKSECERWIDIFGMKGYRFYYQHEDYENGAAYCLYPENPESRCFRLGMAVDFQDSPSYALDDYHIKRNAFHEVMEAFLFRISHFANTRFLQDCDIPDERHNIIHTLENVVFDNDYKGAKKNTVR